MNKKGFTLVELLIVIAIIGIIAAIAIPNLLVALQKGKQKATMGDLKSLGTGIESYITDWAFAPQAYPLDGAAVATPGVDGWFEPFYVKVAPKRDGWGCYWAYGSLGVHSDTYTIASLGRNGPKDAIPVGGVVDFEISPVMGALYICTKIDDFNWDIAFSNGQFTVGPSTKR